MTRTRPWGCWRRPRRGRLQPHVVCARPAAPPRFKENTVVGNPNEMNQNSHRNRKKKKLNQIAGGEVWKITCCGATRQNRCGTHTHTHAHAQLARGGFFEELWCFVVTPARLAGGGLNMGSIMMFDRSSQVDGVDSFRWAENGDFPREGGAVGAEAPLLNARLYWIKKKKLRLFSCEADVLFWVVLFFFISRRYCFLWNVTTCSLCCCSTIINTMPVITPPFIYLLVLCSQMFTHLIN